MKTGAQHNTPALLIRQYDAFGVLAGVISSNGRRIVLTAGERCVPRFATLDWLSRHS